MDNCYGYAGKILYVDLTTKKIKVEHTSHYLKWLGGRSLGAFLLSKMPELESSDLKDQPIIISAGPFTGSDYPLGTRTAVTARNQISKSFNFSNVGGNFGSQLRRAGFDALVIKGQSPEPIYLFIKDDQVVFEQAKEVWGKKISDFQKAMFAKYDKENLSFIGIGPAGENQVPISCLMVDISHAAGWGGSGSLFGVKNLKAIVTVGRQPIKFFDEKGYHTKVQNLSWRVNSSEAMAVLMRGGTHGSAGAGGYNGKVSTAVKNLQDEFLSPEESKPIREENFKQWEHQRVGCYNCQVKCMHAYKIDSDKYGKIEGEGMHANSVRGLASNLGINDPHDLFMLHVLCNDYGLDVDGISSSLGYALESAEKGVIDREQPGGIYLDWGNGESLVKLIEQIARGEGIGKVLGKGAYQAAQIIGKNSENFAMTSKKIGINEQGIRSHKAWALGVMTSTRGSGHLGGSPQTENRLISPEVGRNLFGVPTAGDPTAYKGKGKLVAITAVIKVIIDSMGLCYFAYSWYDLSIGSLDELAEMYYLATGIQLSGKDLYNIGLRIHSLEKYLSYKLGGFSRKDDDVPERFYESPVKSGPYEGEKLDREQIHKELDRYYKTLNWDVETGLPTIEFLKQEGFDYLFT